MFKFGFGQEWFDKDGGAGGGAGSGDGASGNPPAPGASAGGTGSSGTGGTGNVPGDQGKNASGEQNGNPPAGAIVFQSQADIDKVIQERLDRAKKRAEEDTKKATDAATAAAAAKNGEWEKVAHQHEQTLNEQAKKLEEFDALQEKATKFEDALKKQLETLRKDLPASITALLDKLDAAEQLEWLAVNRESLTKKGPDGVPPTPPPNGDGDGKASEEARKTFQRQSRSWF
ncbi:hypothetical protein LARV_02668 [Longilinea arvoryzae]|uniref:Uncharacterized protein n=1 Tax=Longilinea arvoryzae TaxID=360412 RepID=A0A0S7BH22_9CHLR|nr:hypothetical protein [Longilinea arvoryzae]GAP14889.1 hypothetical protein LARV_02668 [Longilinea arvoryzae]